MTCDAAVGGVAVRHVAVALASELKTVSVVAVAVARLNQFFEDGEDDFVLLGFAVEHPAGLMKIGPGAALGSAVALDGSSCVA